MMKGCLSLRPPSGKVNSKATLYLRKHYNHLGGERRIASQSSSCFCREAQTSPLQSGICPLCVSNWCGQWRKHFGREAVWSLPTSILFQIELQSSSWMNWLSNAGGHGYTHSIPEWIWFDPKRHNPLIDKANCGEMREKEEIKKKKASESMERSV